jgi:ParB family chromosome partitioning protein
MARNGLGRGLGALIPGYADPLVTNSSSTATAVQDETTREIRISDINPEREQPRKYFDEEALAQLAESIKQYGVIQPILLNSNADGKYTIIAGERRWRAAKIAGLDTIPAVIRNTNACNAMELALIENLQREDLNPMEEAAAFQFLIETYDMTAATIADRLGKGRSTISNSLRLTKLPQSIQDMVWNGSLPHGHARAIINVADSNYQIFIAKKAVSQGLSTRDVERLAALPPPDKEEAEEQQQKRVQKSLYIAETERKFTKHFGAKFKILQGQKRSRIEIELYSPDDLDRILEMLKYT